VSTINLIEARSWGVATIGLRRCLEKQHDLEKEKRRMEGSAPQMRSRSG